MKQLAGLGASFLHLETAQMPMHVGALHNFELPASYRGDFLADMRRHLAERLLLAPVLRQRLVKMPLNLANPVWVDAVPDLDLHVVGIKLPRGSGQAELEARVGELHAVLLDRTRPLWKFHVFSGLRNGPGGTRRFALYTQLHHAAVDGQAAVALGQAILDLGPEGRVVGGQHPLSERHEMGTADMLRAALGHQLGLMKEAVKAIPATVGVLSRMAAEAVIDRTSADERTGFAASRRKAGHLALAPRMRLNTTVSTTRAFATLSLPLAAVNSTRRRHGASLNDAVLMICSGALRRHFLKHGPLPRKSMVAGVPVSTRAKGDTASDNQATMTLVNLGTHIADPAKRLAHVLAATVSMKANLGALKSLMPSDFPSVGLPWLMEGIGALYAKVRAADRLPPLANLTISNVPGPTVPLYMAGARMLTNYPASIVVHGVALNITVQTYDESLEFGIMACGLAMPEVNEFAEAVQAAFDEFEALSAHLAPVADGGRPIVLSLPDPSIRESRPSAADKTAASGPAKGRAATRRLPRQAR